MFIVAPERFLSGIVKQYGEHPISTDGDTWYLQDCKFENESPYSFLFRKKSIIERTM
ncbi:MAG: hypothetical protein M3Z01_04400 [Thermoproteota archaeon]|nr:hypothetical protein [Thermoproteota archaeon]